MKNALNLLLSFVVFSITAINCFAQSDIAAIGTGHAGASNTSWYVGWNANTTFPLQIRHDSDNVIQFWTNGEYRARIGNSSEFSLIVGDGATPLYNNIDISCVGASPATEGYRYNSQLILSAPDYTNLLCGLDAGNNSTGINNTMVGTGSGQYNSSGSWNTFIGATAGNGNDAASYNVFVGAQAGLANVSGAQNTFVGTFSGASNDGVYNTFIGYASGTSNDGSGFNTFVGSESGINNVAEKNTFVGALSGRANDDGTLNTFNGYKAGYSNTSGNQNTFVGSSAGQTNHTGNYNSFLGNSAGNFANIYSDSVVTDSIGWTKISGAFIADSAYEYLSIGCFFNDSLTTRITYDSAAAYSYYFVDDISLSTDSTIGTSEINKPLPIRIYPNPAKDWVEVRGNNIQCIVLYDILGRTRFSSNGIDSPFRLNTSALSNGIYFIKIKLQNKFIERKIFIN